MNKLTTDLTVKNQTPVDKCRTENWPERLEF